MAVELKVPQVGESIQEVIIAKWLKAEGEPVERDQPVAELESDKATVELPAPTAGRMGKPLKQEGDTAAIGEVIGHIEAGAAGTDGTPAAAEPAAPEPRPEEPAKPEAAQARTKEPDPEDRPLRSDSGSTESDSADEPIVMPAARRVMAERGLSPQDVRGTGPGGRVLKEDVLRQPVMPEPAAEPMPVAPERTEEPAGPVPSVVPAALSGAADRREETRPLTPLRRRVAERLVQAQQNAALLTTFNEIDMSEVMALRQEFRDSFQERHGVKLGFMSFFVKASIEALKEIPQINAEIRDDSIVYRHYYDIGIAIGSGKGLVVPILRNAERLSFAAIEQAIADFGLRARDNKLKPDEFQGGTFTISNGGIYGSLLSTPIVNPPQSGILGMHAIQERPVARNGEVVIRPMMYVALTYDHRIVDGREAVTFLRRIKECIEAPARMLLDV